MRVTVDIYEQCKLLRETKQLKGAAFNADVNLLKLLTELGELTEEWMRHTGRTRHPTSEFSAVEDEYVDLLVTVMLTGLAMGVDHESAIKRKLTVIWDRLSAQEQHQGDSS